MIEIEHRRDIDLSADTVWEEVRHFDRVLEWVPGGDQSSIRVQGEGVGAIRDIELSTQGYVQHRLVAYDDNERSFSYELTAGKPIDYLIDVDTDEVIEFTAPELIELRNRICKEHGLDPVGHRFLVYGVKPDATEDDE